MKHTALILLLAASAAAASAQTPTQPTIPAAKPTTTAAKPAVTAAKPAATATTAKSSTAKPAAPAAKVAPATPPTVAAVIKAPAGIPPVKGLQKPLFTVALRYQEIKIGDGAVAEPGKMYKVFYTGWLADGGRKFDSTDDHPRPPLKDKDGKPVLGDDGKPKQGPPQPMPFPQGFGRVIPGFDQGYEGMKVGGQRRIFIPWQLAYGAKGRPGPDAANPGIPPKADLIFDVELVEVTDIPAPQARPGMMPGSHPMPGGHSMPGMNMPPKPGAPPAPAAPNAAPAPATAPAAPAPAAPAATQPK
jgi:peptidylprolyl isomerase